MAIRVNFALSEQKIHQNISKKQNQNSLLVTGDNDLLDIKIYRKTKIITITNFEKLIQTVF